MFIDIGEIVAIIGMALAVGYIFSGPRKREVEISTYDPIKHYSKSPFIENLKNGIIMAAPAVVLHELAHKIVAVSFGATATIHAPFNLYVVVILMKLMNFPFLFFIGGYVSIIGSLLPWQHALISLAGPLTNLILYLSLIGVVKFNLVKRKHYDLIAKAAKLNLFLFAFNMIPLPGFDGYSFFSSILSYIF